MCSSVVISPVIDVEALTRHPPVDSVTSRAVHVEKPDTLLGYVGVSHREADILR